MQDSWLSYGMVRHDHKELLWMIMLDSWLSYEMVRLDHKELLWMIMLESCNWRQKSSAGVAGIILAWPTKINWSATQS